MVSRADPSLPENGTAVLNISCWRPGRKPTHLMIPVDSTSRAQQSENAVLVQSHAADPTTAELATVLTTSSDDLKAPATSNRDHEYLTSQTELSADPGFMLPSAHSPASTYRLSGNPPTLQTTTPSRPLPVATLVSPTSTSGAPLTASPTYTNNESQACEDDTQCPGKGHSQEYRQGVIAGIVAAVLAGCVLVLASLIRCRKRRHNKHDRGLKKIASWLNKLVGRSATKIDLHGQESVSTRQTLELDHSMQNCREGTQSTVPNQDCSEKASCGIPPHSGRKSETFLIGELLDRRQAFTSTPSDTFCSSSLPPRSHSLSIDSHLGTHARNEQLQSQPGLAMTRYSTSLSGPQISRLPLEGLPTPPPPKLFTLYPSSSTDVEVSRDASCDNYGTTSSMGNATDVPVNKQAETIYVGKARTADLKTMHRHSFTPRVINIGVTGIRNHDDGRRGSERCDHTDNKSRNSSENTLVLERRSTRSDCTSGVSTPHPGSSAKLNSHFGIATWSMSDRETPSKRKGPVTGGENVPSAELDQGQGCMKELSNHYPPISFPNPARPTRPVKSAFPQSSMYVTEHGG